MEWWWWGGGGKANGSSYAPPHDGKVKSYPAYECIVRDDFSCARVGQPDAYRM